VQPGIFILQNDHFVLKEITSQVVSRHDFFDESVMAAQKPPTPDMECVPIAKHILDDFWQASMARAEQITDLVWSIGDKS
jgi:hypothetical protein